MNYFNHQNVQLAYEAVYNQDLCESMEDLGLIGEYDELEEATRMKKYFKNKFEGNEIDTSAAEAKIRRKISGNTTPYPKSVIRGSSRHLQLSRQLSKQNESYELILDYLIQEGYADTLGSAEIILENMSDEWIEEILSEGRIEDLKWKYAQRYGKPEGGDTMRLHVARTKYGSAASAHSDRPSFNRSPNTAPTGKQTPGQAMYKAGRSAQEMSGKVIRPRNPNRNR